ncbi:MAG TPA: hypothetical protein VG839_04945 [Asticcacaulis sp.]|nr:hypothetical protein [Asticcacaulis sp.]
MKRYEHLPWDMESALALVIILIGCLFWGGYSLMVLVSEVPELLKGPMM